MIAGLPEARPAGRVERLVSGGPFGWMIDARLDEIGGQAALELLEDDRMSRPDHYRVWEDGTREQLETEMTASFSRGTAAPRRRGAFEDAHHAHNRERGFGRRID